MNLMSKGYDKKSSQGAKQKGRKRLPRKWEEVRVPKKFAMDMKQRPVM